MRVFRNIMGTVCTLTLFMVTTSTYASTPLPAKFYSPKNPINQKMTFIIPSADKLRQAVRTVTLANKRQQTGIQTVILFQNTAVTLPVVQGIPYGEVTTYDTNKLSTKHQAMPICPKSSLKTIPPVIPEITLPDAPQIYLPILKSLLIEHAKLGGKIVLCPCCDQLPSERIEFLPKEIAPEKFQRLKKQMKIKEGGY